MDNTSERAEQEVMIQPNIFLDNLYYPRQLVYVPMNPQPKQVCYHVGTQWHGGDSDDGTVATLTMQMHYHLPVELELTEGFPLLGGVQSHNFQMIVRATRYM